MKKFFTISQTAQLVHMTAETLRHYDRIGLIKPSKIDEQTGYRYYSEQDIVCLNTIHALKCMYMPLPKIKEILEYEDFSKIAESLRQLEKNADIKIAELNYAKSKIQAARMHYENKPSNESNDGALVKNIPKRVILVSENICEPTLDNLWDYHRHFYQQVGADKKDDFLFEDLAGVYESGGRSQLFAVCIRHKQVRNIKILPEGNYLCANCREENREEVLDNLLEIAKNKYGITPDFTLQIIVLAGILKWNYQIQMFIGDNSDISRTD